MPSWTKDQTDAINLDNSNIIVSAGAGSGKTAVLTARVIRKLKSGVAINRLLVLTFTNEASKEMKDRIRSSIKKEESLKEQLDYIEEAYITTFDSYALSIVKKYHYVLGLSQNIGIIDASIINVLKKKMLDEIFLDRYKRKDEDFLKLVGDFCIKDDEKIKSAILNISKSLDLKYEKEDFLTNYVDNYFSNSYLDKLILEYVDVLKEKIKSINDTLEDIRLVVDNNVYEKYLDAFSMLLSSSSYIDIKNSCNVVLPRVKCDVDITKFKDILKKQVEELSLLTIYQDIDDIKNIYFSTLPYVRAIISVILELNQKLFKFKWDKMSFEFSDIACFAIKIVRENENIRCELKNYYNEIMVDEYQDTNDLQEMFIREIANNNVYMVGDIKQSIYRFRNANPDIFKEKYESYGNNNGGIKIDLLKNFRSREEVLSGINILFDKIMDSYIGGANYKESHRMVFGNNAYIEDGLNDIDHNLEIYNYDDSDKTYSRVLKEIFIIADDIKKKIKNRETVMDKKTSKLRPITYSDFCIILDRGKEFITYKKVFEYLGIPLLVFQDEQLTIEDDMFVLKNLFKMILLLSKKNYNQQEFLYCYTSVARSFLCNMDDSSIYKANRDYLYLKVTDLYRGALSISLEVNRLSPVMLIDKIVSEFNYYDALICAMDVNKAMIRIDYLKKIASNLEGLGFTNDMFLEYLESSLEDKDIDIKYKANTSSDGNFVRLMNIHKSKGLEFPVCYFAGFYEKFNVMDVNARFLFSNKYGIITPYYKEGIGSFINKELFKSKYYLDEVSEKIRLFYVALTRAREKMIIVCSLSNEDSEKCSNIVSDRVRLSYRCFLDMLNSIKSNLYDYVKDIDLDSIYMSHDYEKIKAFNYDEFIPKSDVVIEHINNNIPYSLLGIKHFSKSNLSLVSIKDKKNMNMGTTIHEEFERDDFKDPKSNYVKKFLLHKELSNILEGKIYKEYEFMYNIDNISYHGIIDLLVVFDSCALIIDYKMSKIEDDAYKIQLRGYKDYISNKLGISVKCYLYAIIPDILEEID